MRSKWDLGRFGLNDFQIFNFSLSFVLLLIISLWSWQSIKRFFFGSHQTLYSSRKLSPDTTLYITKHLCHAPCPDKYYYYFQRDIEGDPIPQLQNPFLTTGSPVAEIDVAGDPYWDPLRLRIHYHGTIYNFSNASHSVDIETETSSLP